MRLFYRCLLINLFFIFFFSCHKQSDEKQIIIERKTSVSIVGGKFFINGQPTLAGKSWNGYPLEGLLPNSRMVQGIFDDLNPGTREKWIYPDTKKWDPDRNTDEFITAMKSWYKHGLLAFTINLQGGSPEGYSKVQPWHNSAIDEQGNLRPDYMLRLEKILDRADELGMVVILGIFYFGQDERLTDEMAVIRAVDNTVKWIFGHNYTNVLIEIANECDNRAYGQEIIKKDRIHELIDRVRKQGNAGYRLLVSTSLNGGSIPSSNIVQAVHFMLLHGNGLHDPKQIIQMVEDAKKVDGFHPMPIVFNEDDHFNFDQPLNNFIAAIQAYASWGYFDFRKSGESLVDGYQSVPVDWGINSERKIAFFQKLKEITGGN